MKKIKYIIELTEISYKKLKSLMAKKKVESEEKAIEALLKDKGLQVQAKRILFRDWLALIFVIAYLIVIVALIFIKNIEKANLLLKILQIVAVPIGIIVGFYYKSSRK